MRKQQEWEHYTTGLYVRGYTPFNTHERPHRRWLLRTVLAACIGLLLLLLSTAVDSTLLGTWLLDLLPRVDL